LSLVDGTVLSAHIRYLCKKSESMKRFLFSLALASMVFVSCNDDSENENPPGGGDPGQPNSGNITATINGESFSSANNVARELSYGDFMIRTEADGKSLKFILGEFIGNATYELLNSTFGSHAEYFTTVNGESIGFRSITGQLVISDYDEATQTFNASFDITFGRIGNETITMTGEGTYSQLEIIELEQPASGEITVFYNEREYSDFEASGTRVFNGNLSLQLISESLDTINSSNFSDDSPSSIFFTRLFPSVQNSEIIESTFDAENQTYTGLYKNTDSNIDFEMWLVDVPVEILQLDTISDGVRFYNDEGVVFFESDTLTSIFFISVGVASYLYQFSSTSVSNSMFTIDLSLSGLDESETALSPEPFQGSLNIPDLAIFANGFIRLEERTDPTRVNVKMTFPNDPFYYFIANNIVYEP